MKAKHIIYLLLAVMPLYVSCMKELPDSLKEIAVNTGDTPQESKSLKVSVESLSFSSNAGDQSFNVTSNVSWRVVCDADWVTLTESTTRGTGNGTVKVSVKENSSLESRTATVTISSTDAGSVKVSITQAGTNLELKLNKNDMSFVAAGGSDSFTITCNTSWTVTSDQSWCTVSSSSGSDSGSITVYVSENTSIDSLSATITVKAGDLSQTISVTQAGANAILQIDKSSMSFEASDGSDSFTITSNTSWTITSDQSWCTVSSSSGSGNTSILVYVSENTSTESRSATITLNAAGLSHAISLNQAGAIPVVPSFRTFTVNGVSFKMILVDGGSFTMGATSEQGEEANDDEKPTHSVTLSTYYIGETEVTQELWQAVMGNNPSVFSGLRKPVECVSWFDCQDFVTKLSSLMGEIFRLPTEAEWEFAARGGNNSRCYKYSGSNIIDDVAWYCINNSIEPIDVAQKSPNELGLYDMSGNVSEWCQDRYGNYSSSSQTNPTGPTTGNYRVKRGGSFGGSVHSCSVSCRLLDLPSRSNCHIGLRLAL